MQYLVLRVNVSRGLYNPKCVGRPLGGHSSLCLQRTTDAHKRLLFMGFKGLRTHIVMSTLCYRGEGLIDIKCTIKEMALRKTV